MREDTSKAAQLKVQFKKANIMFLVTDVTKRDVIENTFKTILNEFKQIDVVVNAAGILREKQIELVIATNLVS